MSVADVLMVVIVVGIGLSCFYLVAEYTRWRRQEAAEQRKSASLLALHDLTVSGREREVFASGVVAREAGPIPEASNAVTSSSSGGAR